MTTAATTPPHAPHPRPSPPPHPIATLPPLTMTDANASKRAAAFAAADLVPDGATIGFGTGSKFAFVL